MNPSPDPKPQVNNRSFKIPLLVNLGLIILLALLAHVFSIVSTTDHQNGSGTALVLFVLLAGLFLLNVTAVLLMLILGKKDWFRGFLLASLMVFLIGLGTCGYSLEHLNIGTR